ncbi:hypothetical protein [Halorarum salinum]|uniref:Uncharacterized protein n=1 Tax=Halorarum salinum TaxID=2743089 RepID=A0A7D5LBD5_9EURY|nr:hypothetical protein [Halobaculum salinum]QLG61949.1 hypothetical protein HUG12_09550 [Halobaculum salinum]
MTDNTTDADPVTDNTYQKKTTRRIGDPDAFVVDDATTTTDVGTMNQHTDVVIRPCKCGNTEQELSTISQCSRCTEKCCPKCRITLSRRIRCPDCAEQEFHLTKAVFIALYRLDVHEHGGTDLLEQVEHTAAVTLIEHNYIQIEAAVEEDGTLAVDADNPLSVAGKEALHVGEQLYNDDEDVARLKQELIIQQVANNGR